MCVSVSFLTIQAYLCHDEGRVFIASNVIHGCVSILDHFKYVV